jgi:hypothetical protein
MANHDERPTPARVRVAADDVSLDAHERKVLDEALERGESVRKTVEDAVADYGRWLFAQVFGADSSLVLERRDEHPLWAAILRASDGPRLRLTPEALERAVLCAAYDKRLNSDAWRSLDFGRKARLVRLDDDKLLRKAAQHVLSTNMKTKPLEAYVRELLREHGAPIQSRLTLGRVSSQLARMTERFADRTFVSRVTAVFTASDDDEARSAVIDQVEAAQRTLAALRARLSLETAKKPASSSSRASKRRR